MTPVEASAVTHQHVGRVDQGGFEITWLLDEPLYPHGASIEVRHVDTGVEQLWDLRPGEQLWLTDTPPRWVEIVREVGREVSAA
jgi:hypothetical protein